MLGPIAANEPSLPATLKETIKNLKVGQISDVFRIETEKTLGKPKVPYFWVIQLTRRDPAKVRPFAEVKEQAEQLSMLQRAGGIQVADKKIMEYRTQSKITIALPGYEDLLPVKK